MESLEICKLAFETMTNRESRVDALPDAIRPAKGNAAANDAMMITWTS
jgi:hypothetical protein